MRCWHSTSVHSAPMATACNPIASVPGYARANKDAVQADLYRVALAARRNLRGGLGLLGRHQSRYSKSIMGDETHSQAWQCAIGSVIVATGFSIWLLLELVLALPPRCGRRVADGADRVVDSLWHCRFTC
jgi:hypothetical protein